MSAPKLRGKPSILLDLVAEGRDGLILDVSFAHLAPGERVELSFVETDATPDGKIRAERVLGTASGTLRPRAGSRRLGFLPDAVPEAPAATKPRAHFRLESDEGISDYVFALSDARYDRDEGDAWGIAVRDDSHAMQSPVIVTARVRRQLEAGGASYDWHAGHDAVFYNDGSSDEHGSGGAFHDLLQAIRAARHFVFVVDWSFQPMFCPTRAAPLSRDDSVGTLLLQKAVQHPDLVVAIHSWNHSSAGAADGPNDGALQTLNRLARHLGQAERPPNLLWQATSRTGVGWSHHQKFVVLDAEGPGGRRELQVFWGGLDLTKGRFDHPAHIIDPRVPEAAPFLQRYHTTTWGDDLTDDWYNPEFGDRHDLPRQPWHDIHGSLKGPAAWDFVREFVGRWHRAPSSVGDLGDLSVEPLRKVWELFRKLYRERQTFIQAFEPRPEGRFSAQVYRSLSLSHWGPPAGEPKDELDAQLYALLRSEEVAKSEASIYGAYRHNIQRAERFIYIENQYFMGSGKLWSEPGGVDNDLPELLVQRVLERHRERQPFHVYIVMPMFPEGDPIGASTREIRLNAWMTMEYMVGALFKEMGRRWENYLSFYFLANWRALPPDQYSHAAGRAQRVRDHMRYMVYVHSKLMILDDRYALFGSCNLNDRGLLGTRDSEIACGIWPSHGEEQAKVAIQRFRKRLWLEHFGELPGGWESPESTACVQETRRRADANYLNFRSMAKGPQGHICRLPLVYGDGLALNTLSGKPPDSGSVLPDSPKGAEDSELWRWHCKGHAVIRFLELAE